MAYIDVISLATAKDYLRIDQGETIHDTEVTRMIETYLQFVEKYTNHLVDAKDKEYLLVDGCARIYDYPINAYVSSGYMEEDFSIDKNNTYWTYTINSETTELTLNVGYTLGQEPSWIIDVALEMIDIAFYANDTGKSVKRDLSPLSWDVLNQNKRFFL